MSPLTRVGRLVLVLGAALFAAVPNTADAAAIRSARLAEVRAKRAEVRAYWDNYYTQALREQRMQIKGLNALKVLRVNPDGTLPRNAMVSYLQWRWSLNPVRFARFHPTLAQWIIRDIIIRSTPPNPTPGGVTPPAVPEPSTLVIAVFVAAVGFGARRVATRRQRADAAPGALN